MHLARRSRYERRERQAAERFSLICFFHSPAAIFLRNLLENSMSSSIEQTQGSGAVGKSTLQQQVRGSMACIEKFLPDSVAEECVKL